MMRPILVPFDARWEKVLLTPGPFSFIRRKFPAALSVQRNVYFYVNSPISAVVAKGKLTSIETHDLVTLEPMRKSLMMSEQELKEYVGGRTVGLYKVTDRETATHYATLAMMRTRFRFYPPQGFLFLDDFQETQISEICNFERGGSE